MGLVRGQRRGQGMHIEGRGRSIYMTIVKVLGYQGNPHIVLRVKGLPGCSGLEFLASHGYVKLIDGIQVRVGYHMGSNRRVPMDYDAPQDYRLDKIE